VTARPWIIYGVYSSGSQLEYIGHTINLVARERTHRKNRAWGDDFQFHVIRRAASKEIALAIERGLIKRRMPPCNIAANPKRGQQPIMQFAEARRIWLSEPILTDWALIRMMPGWTAEHAKKAFGPRPREEIDYGPDEPEDVATGLVTSNPEQKRALIASANDHITRDGKGLKSAVNGANSKRGRVPRTFTADEMRDAKAVWRNLKDYPTWDDVQKALPKGFTVHRAFRLWKGRR
jgi:hypothetical protein